MKKGENSLGTTVVAFQTNDGIFIGADSKTSSGSLISNKISDKISFLSKNIVCCRSGSSADSQNLVDFLQSFLLGFMLESKTEPKVRMIVQVLRDFCHWQKNLNAAFICAGWDTLNGNQLYSISLGGCIFNQSLAIMGSGSIFIQGFCDAFFNFRMNEHEAKKFLIKAISLAMLRDCSSGGIIRLALITKKGIKRIFIKSLKPLIKIQNKKQLKFVMV